MNAAKAYAEARLHERLAGLARVEAERAAEAARRHDRLANEWRDFAADVEREHKLDVYA